MPRIANGTSFTAPNGKLGIRVTVDDEGHRRARILPWCTDHRVADERAKLVAGLVKQLRDAGHHEHIEDTITDGALATTHEDLEDLRAVVAKLTAKPKPRRQKLANAPSFIDFAEQWTSGKLHER